MIKRYWLIAHNEIEIICFTNLFDALALLGFHCIKKIIVYFKLLSCKNASRGSDINSTYCMENLSAWCDKVTVLRLNPMKEDGSSEHVHLIVIVSL